MQEHSEPAQWRAMEQDNVHVVHVGPLALNVITVSDYSAWMIRTDGLVYLAHGVADASDGKACAIRAARILLERMQADLDALESAPRPWPTEELTSPQCPLALRLQDGAFP